MIHKVLLILAVFLVSTQACEALIWDVSSSYVLEGKELSRLWKTGLLFPNIDDKKYSISAIHGTVVYDSSQEDSKKVGDSYVVKNAILNIHFTFNVSHTKRKGYSGTGTADAKNIVIGYTKTPGIVNSTASFTFSAVTVSVPPVTPNSDYTNNASSAQKAEFDKLIRVNLTDWLTQYFKSSLQFYLRDDAIQNGIPRPYPSNPYKYQYTYNQTKKFQISINTGAVTEKVFSPGYIVGYNGAINGDMSKCAQYVPEDISSTASLFTQEFVDLFYSTFLKGFDGWTNYVVDETNAKTPYFGFRIADLEPIMPSLTLRYPNLLSSVNVKCSIKRDFNAKLVLNQSESTIDLSANWTCQIFQAQGTDSILDFYIVNDYKVSVAQIGTQLDVRIKSVTPSAWNWSTEGDFPVENGDLAKLYITIVAATFNNKATVGTGFAQANKNSPKVEFSPEAIKISQQQNAAII